MKRSVPIGRFRIRKELGISHIIPNIGTPKSITSNAAEFPS